MITYKGRWQIRITGKDSSWDQRVVITGASSGGGTLAGVVGNSQVADGTEWSLSVEHNDGGGWRVNEGILPDPMQVTGASMRQIIRTKDHYSSNDTDPNDLVIQMDKLGPMFEITVRPYAVDAQTLTMLADGVFVGINGLQYMGLDIKNTWGKEFETGMLLDVSDMGRATLASFGILVKDVWSSASLMATQQTVSGRRICLPPLAVGERTTIYFQVNAGNSRKGKPDVEFVLLNHAGTPDPANRMRFNSRAIFIAEAGYDRSKGEAFVNVPEGTMTLKMRSMAVDREAVTQLCRNLVHRISRRRSVKKDVRGEIRKILARSRNDCCDQQMICDLARILCRCMLSCQKNEGGHGSQSGGTSPGSDTESGGWARACLPGGLWLPLKFDYRVETNGGYTGQYGPLPFQDPWWKVLLLIIAVIAWLVGLVESIVADETGWGNVGDYSKKIGTVGVSNRVTTDACIIELDGSRPAIQKVADAIYGEPNNSPVAGLNTVITIDPQVAFTSLASADVVGKLVYKSGSRTGLTHGIIASIGNFSQCRGDIQNNICVPDPNHPDLNLPNQFTIGADPAFGEELFDDHGDSGSIVLSREPDSMNQVVGLLHSGNGGTSPIQDVLAALNLRLQ